MTKALFALHGAAGKIKRTERGNYKLLLKDLDQQHTWFSNRPDRIQGTLTTEEIVEGWDSYFADNSPNSIVSYQDKSGNFQRLAFEHFKPKIKSDGATMTARIKLLPAAESDQLNRDNKDNDVEQDPVTGFRLERGQSLHIVDPSVVVDDYTLSQITFINNTDHKMQIDYVIGEMKAGAILTSRDLPAGKQVTVAGTTHDKWDLSANVMVWDKASWKKGLIVQVDNPWYETPQLEINMKGSYYNSSRFNQDTWYGPKSEEQWLLDSPSANYRFKNDNPNDGDGNKAWTFEFYTPQTL
jgi:hypothetical protein